MTHYETIDRHGMAELAGVALGTVDVWRSRSARGLMSPPLPEPVGRVNGGYVWRKTEFRKWLRSTGRLADK